MKKKVHKNTARENRKAGFRLFFMLGLLLVCTVGLASRAVTLQVIDTEFLQGQGEARYLREVEIPATRGVIYDRNQVPLAVSTPVESLWVHPGQLLETRENIDKLAAVLGTDADELERKLNTRSEKEFVWLRRHLPPSIAAQVSALELPGVNLEREYRRFYPSSEVSVHVLGFTNIDDVGQEGLELEYNDWLQGVPGSKQVIKDRRGRVVEDVRLIRPAQPGRDLTLTLDNRLQYLAYRELKRTMLEHNAQSGSVVLLDVATSQILAMVNAPTYNPNQSVSRESQALRNRAVTDVIEPGSVMKPFAIAAALETGMYTPDSPIDTEPGSIMISGHTIHDTNNNGMLDVTGVITKSSNVGTSKIALSLEPEHLWGSYNRFGFGKVTGSGFPGESAGVLRNFQRWHKVEQATIAYGYGISVTALQLARAYTAIANSGRIRAPSFIKQIENPLVSVMDPAIAAQVRDMLLTVTGPEGTGKKARVKNYLVGGKTGTSRKASAAGYEERYIATFAGYAPASDPQLVLVVVIDDPQGKGYYGGTVAGPLFSRVMSGSLRLLDIAPDDFQLAMAQQKLQVPRLVKNRADNRAP
ncbi:MAG: penicillin-binding protein 2 [Xanthomonadales bacterium]|nr:penicillin-binding protein 2 [Xanthomonadales bacterium]